MPKWGELDASQLIALHERMQKAINGEVDEFVEQLANKIAASLKRTVKKLTPVGEYSDEVHFFTAEGKEVRFPSPNAGKEGGTLRRGWKVKVDAGKQLCLITISNNTFYAPYVEYGHRKGKEGKHGWQPGQFMMTIGLNRVRQDLAPALIKKELLRYLEKIMGGGK